MYIPSGELLAMALAAQAQRPTANQQTPMFNWNSLAGPPSGGMAEDSSMALTMPMPVPAPVAMPAPPPAMPVAMPQQAPVPIPADQMVQQMYAPVGVAPQQEMMPVPAPVYSMYPEAPQAPAQPMAPINLPGPSLTDLAAYEMFGPPVVPGPGYAPVTPQPLPQQTAWQQEPVGYNPMMMDATASELYGMPVPQPIAAAPTQYGFDPSALTGATGATAMQTRTAMPQPMMAAGAPPQELPPLPLPPSMYVPGRQQPGAMAQRGPATGAVMPYQPMTDLGVPAEDLYQMFAGISPDQPLAMLAPQGGGEGQPPTAQPDQGMPSAPADQPTTAQPTQPGQPAFTREFKPFDVPYKTPSGKEFQAKVLSYDPKSGTATLEGPNKRSILVNRSTPNAASVFQAIDEKYKEQKAEQSKLGPGNYEMLPEMQGMPMRIMTQNAEGKPVWTPARQSGNGLSVEYFDPVFETTTSIPLRNLNPEQVYMPEQDQAAFGAEAFNSLFANLLPAAKEMAIGGYERELANDDKAYYTPQQLAAMTRVTVESTDANGIPKYKVEPITEFASGTRQVEDENGRLITEEFAEEVPDPRVPPGYLEGLQKNLDMRVQQFVEQGETNAAYLTAKPENLADVRTKRLELGLKMAQDELAALVPGTREYKAKQKEVDRLDKQVQESKVSMTMDVGDGTMLTAQPTEIRISDANPRSWNALIRQASGGLASSGPGSQSRAGYYLTPEQYAENYAFNYAMSSNYGRGKSIDRRRTPEYDIASGILINHVKTAVEQAAAKASNGDPAKLEQFIDSLYNKPSTFWDGDKGKQQTLKEVADELTAAQAEMDRALVSGETKRLVKAENNLKAKFNKLRNTFRLPDGTPVKMTPEAFRNSDVSNIRPLYDTGRLFETTVGGLESQVTAGTTVQPEKLEGFSDRPPGGGPRTAPPTSIRPIILGAMNKGFRGDNRGVMSPAATDPTQFDFFASQIGNKNLVADFAKSVMQGGIYAESGSGFADKKNADVADALFKGMNLLMFEDSPAGTKMREAYGMALYDMLDKSSGFSLGPGSASFGKMFDDAFHSGNASALLDLVNDPRKLKNIASRFQTTPIYLTLNKSPYMDYFTGGSKAPENSKLFQTAVTRFKNAAIAIGRAKNGGFKNPSHPLGMNPISGEQYVFFASPLNPGPKSLLALPSVGFGYSAGSAPMLKKADVDKLINDKELPSVSAYDVPAAMLQLNAGAVFTPFVEQIQQALGASSDPDIKDVIRDIGARQVDNHKQDMSSAPARAGTDNNTKLDSDGKDIGRRWFIEGGLIFNLFYPTRNSTVIP